MIDGVNVHIKLTWSPAAFSIMIAAAKIGGNAPTTYKIKIKEITLYVQKISSSAMCQLVIIDAMKITPVRYLIRHVSVCSF